MEKNTIPTHNSFEGTPSAERFTLADRGMVRNDYYVEEGHFTKRFIDYPTPNEKQRALRNHFQEKGLVLGKELPSGNDRDQFAIPISARAITHEASTVATGRYAYDDSRLFYDLGKLLGAVAHYQKRPLLVLDEVIGRNIAILEYTKVNEPKIFFVPGFETQVKLADTEDDVLNCYSKRLYDEFDDQFQRHSVDFLNGFRAHGD